MDHQIDVRLSPIVAAVVPCRNRRLKTERFLDSFTKQSYPNLNIIVVDANSTDGTLDILYKKFPSVGVVRTNDESYWTASSNRGVELALAKGCDYVLTINDDSYAALNYVDNLVSLAESNMLKILASRIDFFKAPGLIWSLGSYSSWGSKDLFQLSYHAVWEDALLQNIGGKSFVEIEAAAGNGVLIHRSVFEKIGLYDEVNMPHYHADSEFIMRARAAGILAYATPKVVVYNDFPLPNEAFSEPQLHFKNVFEEFTYTSFNKKSHLLVWPRLFAIQKYCPWHKKIPTYRKAVFLVMIDPIFEKVLTNIMSFYSFILNYNQRFRSMLKKSFNRIILIFS